MARRDLIRDVVEFYRDVIELTHLQRETEGMDYDEESHSRIREKVKELKQQKEEQDRLVGKMKAEIRQLENLLDQRNALLKK